MWSPFVAPTLWGKKKGGGGCPDCLYQSHLQACDVIEKKGNMGINRYYHKISWGEKGNRFDRRKKGEKKREERALSSTHEGGTERGKK